MQNKTQMKYYLLLTDQISKKKTKVRDNTASVGVGQRNLLCKIVGNVN